MPVYGGVDPTVRHHRIGDPEGVEADLSARPPSAATNGRVATHSTVVEGATADVPPAPTNMPGTTVNVIRAADSAPDDTDEPEAPTTDPDDDETAAGDEPEVVTSDVVVPVGINAKDMRKWIGHDPDRARAALEYEDGLEEPRQSVIRHAESVLQE